MTDPKNLILIVEDDMNLAELIKQIVESTKKYEALSAYSAGEAFRMLEANKYPGRGNKIKCVLLDIKLPDLDGLSFLEELRKKYKEEIGVILETAYEDEEKWQRALKGKVVGYLIKPFTAEQILKNLDVFFEGEAAKEGMKILTYDQYFEKFKKYKRGGGH